MMHLLYSTYITAKNFLSESLMPGFSSGGSDHLLSVLMYDVRYWNRQLQIRVIEQTQPL